MEEKRMNKNFLIAVLLLIGIAAVIAIRCLYEQQLFNNQIALLFTVLTFLIILPLIRRLEK